MTAAAKRLKLIIRTLTYHSTGFFSSLAQHQHSVSCGRAPAGAAAGAASASDAPPMRGCVLARTPIGRRDESRATSRRSNSSHIPIAATCRSLAAGSEAAPPPPLSPSVSLPLLRGRRARRGAAVRCSAASRHQRRRSSGRRSGAASLTCFYLLSAGDQDATERVSHWRRVAAR
jgi:hypothetical protein